MFTGEYESAFRGSGIEFEEFRDYVPGDDVRRIDWHVTARMNKPYVKVYREEREQTIFFLVDVSRSLQFGRRKQKIEAATEVAALLAYAAVKSHDKVGLIIFSDRIEIYIPPKKGRGHVWRIIAALLSHNPVGRQTSIGDALNFFLKVARRKTVCFLISDFLGDGFFDVLRVASLKHEMAALRIVDGLEKSLPRGALADFTDLESGQRLGCDLTSGRDPVGVAQKSMTEYLNRQCGSSRIDLVNLSSDEDYVEALLHYFMKREKKR